MPTHSPKEPTKPHRDVAAASLPSRRAVLGAGLVGSAALVVGCEDDTAPAGSSKPSGSGGATAAGSSGPSTTGGPRGAVPTGAVPTGIPDFDPADWESVRAQFLLDPALAQFAAFVLSPHTRQIDAAIQHHRARLGNDTETALFEGFRLEERVRRAAATYLGGRPAQVALTDSTTMGIATMYGGLELEPGDEVLTTTHDFFSTTESLRLLAKRSGARVRRVRLYDAPWQATVGAMVTRLADAISARTRVVGVTWVHSSTGVRVPVREIADAVAEKNRDRPPADRILLCVDGVHGFGAVDVDVADLGCDFLATGTHKWLFGPRGTGVVWARDWAPLTELIPSFSGPDGGRRLSPGGYHDFEHRWALAEAFEFQRRIGRTAVVERTTSQASQLKAGLTDIAGVRLVTPTSPDVSAGIVCCDLSPKTLPANAVMSLREQGIVTSATPYRRSYLRLGPSIATTPEQVDAAVHAIAELA